VARRCELINRMTLNRDTAAPVDQVICPDSTGHTLLTMAVPPERRTSPALSRIPVLGRRGGLPDGRRREALVADAARDAVPLPHIEHIDAEAVAAWIAQHYPQPAYPGVVLGSPHGAAVHLAAACGAAWLPTTFTVTAPWPSGDAGNWAAAMTWGARLAERIIARNPQVTVRQVHDPVLRGPLCGATVSLQVRWRTLPTAYRAFLRSRVAPDGAAVLVRDVRTWPVLSGPAGYSFQIGTPTSGRHPGHYTTEDPSFRRLLHGIGIKDWPAGHTGIPLQYADTSGDPRLGAELRQAGAETGRTVHRVLYRDAQALSACVADLYRAWLTPANGGGRCFVGTGRMIDPWQTIAGGSVPYWCESSSRTVTDAAQLWLAGSEPFDQISVLPEPPGTQQDDTATLRHWRSVAAFARRKGTVDTHIAGRYPLLPAAPRHATWFLSRSSAAGPTPAPMPVTEAVRRLSGTGGPLGLLVV
jgi:hypothetical protein